MAWLRIDDRVRTHPKLVAAGPAAAWFWFCGICYCREHLTDGFVPSGIVPTLAPGVTGGKKLAGRLVTAGLWHVTEGGFLIHDFLDWNPSRAEVQAGREADKARKKRGIQTESDTPPIGIRTTPSRDRAGDAGLGTGFGSGSSGSNSSLSTPVVEGRGAAFWDSWRQAQYRASSVVLRAFPKASDLPTLVEIVEMVEDDARLQFAVDRFVMLTPEQARAMNVKAQSLGYFKMALPRLLQPDPAVGVTTRTAGNMSALEAFVSKGKAS